jgi:hypothetical protein
MPSRPVPSRTIEVGSGTALGGDVSVGSRRMGSAVAVLSKESVRH